MDGKDAIINKIISDAEEKCRAAENSARERADGLIETAEDWAAKYSAAQEEILSRETADIVSRRLTVADLDVRKISLAAKQRVIGEAFDLALKNLCALDGKKYAAFIEKLLENYAEDGDTVVLSEDFGISAETIKKMKVFSEKKLKIAAERGSFKGGIRLAGKICDKDLSFAALITVKKESVSAEVLKILFADGRAND